MAEQQLLHPTLVLCLSLALALFPQRLLLAMDVSPSTAQLDAPALCHVVRQLVNDVQIARGMENDSESSHFVAARCTLRNLRLTCRDFADMAIIKSALIDHITLRATGDQLSRVLETRFATLARFVTGITFKPSPCSPRLTLRDFQKLKGIWTCRLEREHPSDNPYWEEALRTFRRLGVNCPDDMADVGAAYALYRKCAADDVEIVQNRSLQRAWITALKTLSGASSFVIGNIHGFWPLWINSKDDPSDHCDSCGRRDAVVFNMSSQGNDMFSRAVTESLACAQTRIGDLTVDCSLQYATDNMVDLWSSRLRLEHMTRLSLVETVYWPTCSLEQFSQCVSCAGLVCSHFVKKAQNSFQVLNTRFADGYGDWGRVSWHTVLDFNLPTLHSLCLLHLFFPQDVLGRALEKYRGLRDLGLEDSPLSHSTDGMKPHFDANRQHTNSLQLRFCAWLPICQDYRSDFECENTRACSEPLLLLDMSEGQDELLKSLLRYLDAEGEWDGPLQK